MTTSAIGMSSAPAAISTRSRRSSEKGGYGAITTPAWSRLAAITLERAPSLRLNSLRLASTDSMTTWPAPSCVILTRSPTATWALRPRVTAVICAPAFGDDQQLPAEAGDDGRRGRGAQLSPRPKTASVLAAQMKSFSVMPPTECVLQRTLQRL